MFNNPLIKRYRLSAMRPAQVFIYIAIYLIILLLMGIINEKSTGFSTKMFKDIYFQLLFIQVIFLFGWAPFNSSAAIRDEIISDSYDFFKMLPLTPAQKTAGILVGKNLFVFILAAINFFLMFICGIIGEFNLKLQFQLFVVIISVSFFLNSGGLLSSIQPNIRKNEAGSRIVIVLLAIFGLPFLFGAIDFIDSGKQLEGLAIHFYNIKIPVLLLISLFALFYSCWMIKGSLRKFTYERSPLFTPLGAVLFMVTFEIIVLGLFFYQLKYEPYRGDIYFYGVASLIPALIIPFASRKTCDDYIEFLGRKQSQSANINLKAALLGRSNMLTWIAVFLAWTIFTVAALFISNKAGKFNFMTIAVYFSAYLFVLFMFELFNVLSPSIKKIGLLLGFIVGLYIALPMILGGVLDNEHLVKYSPIGLFILFIDNEYVGYNFLIGFTIFNLVLASIPGLFVFGTYLRIVQTRYQME